MFQTAESRLFLLGVVAAALVYWTEGSGNAALAEIRVVAAVYLLLVPIGFLALSALFGSGALEFFERLVLSMFASLTFIVLAHLALFTLAGMGFSFGNSLGIVVGLLVLSYGAFLARVRYGFRVERVLNKGEA